MLVASVIYAVVNCHELVANLLPLVSFVAWCFGWNSFYVHDRNALNLLFSNLGRCYACSYDNELRPTGVVVGAWFCYVLHRGRNDRGVTIYCTRRAFDRMTNRADNGCCKYLCRSGETGYVNYKLRMLPVTNTGMLEMQERMFEHTMRVFTSKGSAVVFLEGRIGAGKTSFAHLMALRLGAYLVDEFVPTAPSDSFDNLYWCAPKNAPLVILLDEVDDLIREIHGGVRPHKQFHIHVRDRCGWNSMLDRIQLGWYPDTLIVMCSNTPKTKIDAMHESYLRDCRVNAHFVVE